MARGLLSVALLLLWPAARLGAEEPTGDAAVLAVLERLYTPEQRSEVAFLRHLGWRFVTDPQAERAAVHGGQPGHRESLAAAHAAGDLRILIPPRFGDEEARNLWPLLSTLHDVPASRLAYKHRLAVATRRATARLDRMNKQGRFVFPELLGIVHSPFFTFRMPGDGWRRRGRMDVAEHSSRQAMESFFRRGGSAECYGGQLLATYAIQYELFGPAWFDAVFPAEEIVVGRPRHTLETPLIGAARYDRPSAWRALLIDAPRQRMDPVLALAPYGPLAFVGLAGLVHNQDRGEFTNDNLIVVSISARALADLVRGGGLCHVAREAARVWQYGNRGKGLFRRRADKAEAMRQVDAVLAQPVFQEILVYVHPDGVVPLGTIVKKKLPDAKTPVTLRINLNGLDDVLYQRFRAAYQRGFLAGLGVRAR